MKKDLSGDIFDSNTTYLGEQNGYISSMKQSINSAIINENYTEFPNEFMKTQYSEISNILSRKNNSNIEEMITLGKKNVKFSTLDTQSSNQLSVAVGESDLLLQELTRMVSSLNTSVSVSDTSIISVDALLSILPEEREGEIRSGNIFVSEGGKYIYLNGYAYEVYNPAIEMHNPQVTISSPESMDWQDVYTQSYYASDFDCADCTVSTINNFGDNGDTDASAKFNAYMLGFSFLQAVDSATTDVRIDVKFQENSNGDRRVVMGVHNSQYEDMYNSINNGIPYSVYDNTGPFASQYMNISQDKYEELTGNEANRWSVYDVQFTVDERHKDEVYHSYLSFDQNGNLQETVTVYSGDKKEMVEREGVAGEIGFGKTVYEYELNPTPQNVPDMYNDAIMNSINGGF